jgi:hypothetical protein
LFFNNVVIVVDVKYPAWKQGVEIGDDDLRSLDFAKETLLRLKRAISIEHNKKEKSGRGRADRLLLLLLP